MGFPFPFRVHERAAWLAIAWLSFATTAHADPPKKKVRRDDRVAAGLTLFVGSYAYPALMGTLLYRQPNGKIPTALFIPVAGPYIALAHGDLSPDSTIAGRLAKGHGLASSSNFGFVLELFSVLTLEGVEYGLLAIDPIVQTTGITMATVGAVTPHRTMTTGSSVRPKISLAPMWMSGPAIGVSITSW